MACEHALGEGEDARERSELELLDWRRRVFALYTEIRAANDPAQAWGRWCAVRDELFRTHPQSPVPPDERASYPGVPCFPYDPALLTEVESQAKSRDLFLLTSDFNEGAQRFYRRMGYTQIGAIPSYVVPDVTELIFRKQLH